MPDGEIRDIEELRDSGLLWLINRVALHPRGYALAFHYDDDGDFIGWSLMGDGTEPWAFDHEMELEGRFMQRVEQLFNVNRPPLDAGDLLFQAVTEGVEAPPPTRGESLGPIPEGADRGT